MRGIAIGMVVAYHYWPDRFPIGSSGVDLFFVLSAYLMLLALSVPATEIVLRLADPTSRMATFSIPALIYAGGVLLVARGGPMRLTVLRPLAWLGIGAYSIYLFHIPILHLAGSRALAFPITLAIAWASWRYVEAPLIGFARNRWRYGYVSARAAAPIVLS